MIPDASFLRRIPLIVAPAQRLRIEAIVFASDILSDARVRIQDTLLKIGPDGVAIGHVERTTLFASTWVIVDQLNVIRQLLRALYPTEHGRFLGSILKAMEPARILRNKMEHLSGSIPNLAAAKGTRSPIFGALNYLYVPPEGMVDHDGQSSFEFGRIINVWGGDLGTTTTEVPFVNPAGRAVTIPISFFQLVAFGLEIGG